MQSLVDFIFKSWGAPIILGVIIYLVWRIVKKSFEVGAKNIQVAPEDFNYLNPVNYIYLIFKKFGPILLLILFVIEIALIVGLF